jgi:hypothetical protein
VHLFVQELHYLGIGANRARWVLRRPVESATHSGHLFSTFAPRSHARPKGSRNKTILRAGALLDGQAEAVIRKAIELAKQGDTTALRLCIARILPTRKDRPISFDVPRIETVADGGKAPIASAVADGETDSD